MFVRYSCMGTAEDLTLSKVNLGTTLQKARSKAERIVVLSDDALASATIVGNASTSDGETRQTLVAGHEALVFIAHGEGFYTVNGHAGTVQPNTLIAAPPGEFTCVLSRDREAYVLLMSDPRISDKDQRAFMPFSERKLCGDEARSWQEQIRAAVDDIVAARFATDDIRRLKAAASEFLWFRDSQRDVVDAFLTSLWSRIGEQLTVESFAREIGYTANYLNDLTRSHTGRSVGRWITDMRMARARATLEKTKTRISDVALSCGFEDPGYFSRAFRRAHGVAPLTWRIAAQLADDRHADVALPPDLLHPANSASAIGGGTPTHES